MKDGEEVSIKHLECEALQYSIAQLSASNKDKLYNWNNPKSKCKYRYLDVEFDEAKSAFTSDLLFLCTYIHDALEHVEYVKLDHISAKNSKTFLTSATYFENDQKNLKIKLDYDYSNDSHVIHCKSAVFASSTEKSINTRFLKD